MSLGKRLELLRKERELSQEELVNQLSVSRQVISHWAQMILPAVLYLASCIPISCTLIEKVKVNASKSLTKSVR